MSRLAGRLALPRECPDLSAKHPSDCHRRLLLHACVRRQACIGVCTDPLTNVVGTVYS